MRPRLRQAFHAEDHGGGRGALRQFRKAEPQRQGHSHRQCQPLYLPLQPGGRCARDERLHGWLEMTVPQRSCDGYMTRLPTSVNATLNERELFPTSTVTEPSQAWSSIRPWKDGLAHVSSPGPHDQ